MYFLRKGFTSLVAAILFLGCAYGGDVAVKGYYRKNGTYVAPHYRSAPDGNFYNNWSTKGNVNPYTGEAGTKVTPPEGYTGPGPATNTYLEEAKRKDRERAAYWQERGYTFNPDYISASRMDYKVQNIERAKYWKEKGYDFNPEYMPANMMDSKVRDIERSKYWKTHGYDFDPTYMTEFMMDEKVKDIQRAKYWKERGFDFDPSYMTAFGMDSEAKRRGYKEVEIKVK